MSQARVSMVVCSFQQAAYLRQTLESVTRQVDLAEGELEIIVIDGGSTDGSVDIIREFAPHLAYWVSEPDRGQTDGLRKGFSRATGNIHGWLCSDDLLEPRAVREVIDFFDAHPQSRFCYGDAWWIDSQGQAVRPKKEIPFNWFIFKYDHDYIPQPSAFWRRELYDEVGGLDENFDLAMDADLFARYAERTRPVHVSAYWSRIRSYPQQKTQRNRNQGLEEMRQICKRHGAHVDNPAVRLAGRTAARALRSSWKLVKGCYWA